MAFFSNKLPWDFLRPAAPPHPAAISILYDPHKVDPVVFMLEEARQYRATPAALLLDLWHAFAIETRAARPCAYCDCKRLRLDFGLKAEVVDVANFFHENAALPGYQNIDPLISLSHIAFQAGHIPEADHWLDEKLKQSGWSLHALWAVTRDKDWRHTSKQCWFCDDPSS